MRAEQPGGVVFDDYIAFFELQASGTQAFDFPSLQHESGFEALFNKIIMPGNFVECDGTGARFGFCILFGHGAIIR